MRMFEADHQRLHERTLKKLIEAALFPPLRAHGWALENARRSIEREYSCIADKSKVEPIMKRYEKHVQTQ